ncbi:MAG: glycoside hydrolase family 127 protein [Lachnospiraceae bacterium]|nr:glycoside hydrolase family 127 protein [Lachnospiraceae bacterium]
MLKPLSKSDVKVTGGVFRDRMNVDKRYLLELDSQCLLQNFYIEAGIIMPGLQMVPDPAKANLHWGWEAPVCQLRGHFLGHWLSAAAAFVATDGDNDLKVKLDFIVSELARCQELNGGEWVGSIPEKYMNRLARPEYIWSPQYTMHKTVMGLVDAYRYAGNKQALEIVDKLADWYVKWVDTMTKVDPRIAYKGEQGGMLEQWAELYSITGNEKYKTLIDAYKDHDIYKRLEKAGDALSDDHTNASIPVSHGSARLYEVLGDKEQKEYFRKVTERFWEEAVDNRGMLATTGANAGEFWIPPHRMAQYIGDNDQEFCTVYNMVRLADYLYRWTGESRYADYIESAVYNGFLAQQNMFSGMPTYFLPLKAGSKKKWGSKRNDFWCCHGTMVQSPTLYPSLIYFTDEDEKNITVAQYIPSRAEVKLGNDDIVISQKTDMISYNNQVFFDDHAGGEKTRWSIRFDISGSGDEAFTVKLRVPAWSASEPKIVVSSGEVSGQKIENGYIVLEIAKPAETAVNILFDAKVRALPLDDQPELAALVDGPIVLAGLTDKDRGITYSGDVSTALYQRTEHTYTTYVWKQNNYITKDQPENFELKPLYDVTDETYTVYFTLKEK